MTSARSTLTLSALALALLGLPPIAASAQTTGAVATVATTSCKLPPKSMVLSGDTKLTPGCSYNTSIRITQPLTLDCRGAVLEGANTLMNGIVIDSQGVPLSGVTIKNCQVQNYTNTGITVTWSSPDIEKAKFAAGTNRDGIYARAPQNIVIDNVLVNNSGTVGIYVDDYVSGVTVNKSTIQNSQSVGIYFEGSTRNNLVNQSAIVNNGWTRDKGEAWQPGIALDSSANNTINMTRFQHNGKAGIALYRNCWENAAVDKNSLPRWQGASNNLIGGNLFLDERIGVWVGSRMDANLASMKCGMPAYLTTASGENYVLDDAKNNQIRKNSFKRIWDGAVIVEDDGNQVVGNTIEGMQRGPAIKVGAPVRAKVLGKPVAGTVVTGNTLDGAAVGAVVTDR